jgi:hypothetical protein
MATTATTPTAAPLAYDLTALDGPGITADKTTLNVRSGPVSVYSVEADNMLSAANTKVWVKLYDNITAALVPGTTAPDMIFPVPAVVVAADAAVRGEGLVGWECLEGIEFVNGVSVLCTLEDGDAADAAPDGSNDVIVKLIT